MDFRGQRVLLFGDSHSDGATTPGGQLAALLRAAGATVDVDAQSGRSARNYFTAEDGARLLAADVARRPDVVVFVLGSNAIDHDLATERTAFTRLLTQFPDATVFCVGPPWWPPKVVYHGAQYNAGAAKVIAMEQALCAAEGGTFLDARPMTLAIGASGRARMQVGELAGQIGIHFNKAGGAIWAAALFQALAAETAPPLRRTVVGAAVVAAGAAFAAVAAFWRGWR